MLKKITYFKKIFKSRYCFSAFVCLIRLMSYANFVGYLTLSITMLFADFAQVFS